jgi:hypothetical protein
MISKAFACSTVVALAIATASGIAVAQGNAFGPTQAPSLVEGAWEVSITPYVCASGVDFPVTYYSYLTFGAGGTMFEANSNPAFQPGQRGPGHGYWERTGLNTYEAMFQAFIQFTTNPPAVPPTPNYVRGSQRVEQAIELIDADHWRATWDVTFRDVNGNPVPPSGCAHAVATRMP